MKELRDTGERLITKGNEQTLTYGEHLSRYMAVRSLVEDKVVLDVASGTGYGAALIADSQAKKVYGLDYSEDAVEYSRKHYSRPNLEFIVGDAHTLPFENQSMDVVISLETIEHLKQPEEFVKEVKRVLKNGGVFVVSTPNDDEFMEGNDFHLHEFQLPELKNLIKSNFNFNEFYFQGTYFAATLQKEANFNNTYETPTVLAKTFKQRTEKAIYFLAVASDINILPELEENVILADRWNTKDDIERDLKRRKSITDLNNHIEELGKNSKHLRDELNAVYASTSWKATRWLRRVRSMFASTRD